VSAEPRRLVPRDAATTAVARTVSADGRPEVARELVAGRREEGPHNLIAGEAEPRQRGHVGDDGEAWRTQGRGSAWEQILALVASDGYLARTCT